jgi:predicted nucleic acid-binding Zn ribbon protein
MEAMQKMGAGPLRKCRSCSGRLEKLISRTSFSLKGGGWCSEGYNKGSKSLKDSKPAKSAESSAA